MVGIITRSDLFRVIINLTGLGKKGIQFAIRVKDKPGPIKEVRQLVHEYGGRIASILSSWDNVPLAVLISISGFTRSTDKNCPCF